MAEARPIAGKYQLLRKIAQGGMAEVYLAKQTGLEGFEKLVVIKRILPHLVENEEFVRMFLDEARTAADLRHANVVSILEIGEDQGTYFIAMEFLHGQDVRRVLRRAAEQGKRVPTAHALQILIDAANGLDYAHKKSDLQGRPLNIVHRDISPQNIIVTYEGTTKIVDFGIAKAASQSTHTASGVLKGKYSYMSPEQASGQEMDHRTDQFALGIVLYETTTMTRLFKLQNEIMTLHAIIECNVKQPMEINPDYPQALNDIVMKSLARKREDRFTDCRELAEALEEYLAEERIVHSPSRLSTYMNELFKDELAEEKALGTPVIDAEGSGSANAPPGTQKARRTTGGGAATPSPAQPTRARTGSQEQANIQNAGTQVTASHAAGTGRSRAQPAPAPEPGDLDFQTAPTAQTAVSSIDEMAARARAQLSGAVSVVEPTVGGQTGQLMMSATASRRKLLWAGLGLCAVVGSVGVGTFMALQPGTGRLTVRTSPSGARVLVDGHELPDRTPLIVPELRAGRSYAVRLEMPGFAPHVGDVKITGENTQELTITLKKESPSATLRFKSTPPGARVYFDGRPLEGVTPLELPPMPVDGTNHSTTFSLERHADDTKRFALKEGLQDVVGVLQPTDEEAIKAHLNITSTPSGAAITLAGKALGNAPLTGVDVTGGKSYAVTAKLAGFEPQERLVDVDKGATVEVAFDLEKETAAEAGFLTLETVPETNVYAEKGRFLGKTPLRKVKVAPGTLTLRFVNDKKGIDFTDKVKIDKDGETTRRLNVPKGRLKVVVKPWAFVYVDGVKVERPTPFPPRDLFVGKHEIRLVNPNLAKDEKETVVIRAGEDTKVTRTW